MRAKTNPTGMEAIFRPVITGCIAGAVITVLILAFLAFLLTVRDFPAATAVPLVSVAAGVGALFAGFAASKTFKKQGLQIGALTGLVLFLIILLISTFISGSNFSVLTVIKLVIMLLSASIGGILAVNTGRKRKIV